MTLFNRRISNRTKRRDKVNALAHLILDRAAAGHDISEDEITWALKITGDIG
jgi:hypothetical protein